MQPTVWVVVVAWLSVPPPPLWVLVVGWVRIGIYSGSPGIVCIHACMDVCTPVSLHVCILHLCTRV